MEERINYILRCIREKTSADGGYLLTTAFNLNKFRFPGAEI